MGNRLSLLVIDDEETNRMILKNIFRDSYNVLEAENGLAALQIMEKTDKIDIILLDLIMPGMDGKSFLKKIRRLDGYASIPVLITTNVDRKEAECKMLELGADGFIPKPYDPKLIQQKVYNIAQRYVYRNMEYQKQLQESMLAYKNRTEHDMLTQIYNKEKFYQETEKVLEKNKNQQFVIAVWNIDRFKMINELYGNNAGDSVLKEFSRFIAGLFHNEGVYGRLEADHFAVCTSREYLLEKLNEIKSHLISYNGMGMIGHPVMFHVGFYEIEDIHMPVNLMCDRANVALNTIKDNYMQRYTYYNDQIKSIMLTEQTLINDMENALIEDQFYIQIQPIVQAKSGDIISGEALVRWKHNTLNNLSSGVFVPVFEKNGFIEKVDMCVVDKVCTFLAENRKQDIANVPISINLSRIDFYDPSLCDNIVAIVDKYNIEHSLLNIEITESAYIDNPKDVPDMVSRFHENGFHILMDDFGSGYSSLNMLKDVPVDILKIDMKFIDKLESSQRARSILHHIIQMAKSLDMRIIAEGVETRNQRELLVSMECDYIQGFYFSRPVSVAEYKEKLVEQSGKLKESIHKKQTMSKRESEEKQALQYWTIITRLTDFCANVDLSEDRILSTTGNWFSKYDDKTNSYNCFVENLLQSNDILNMSEDMVHYIRRSDLIAAFQKGIRKQEYDFNYRRGGEQSSQWYRSTLYCIHDSETGHVLMNWQIRNIQQQKLYDKQIKSMAQEDPLTGLLNRTVFEKYVENSLQTHMSGEGYYAILMVDVDHFKEVNDTFGHEFGDSVLCSVADILRNTFRKSDFITRLGGDEFMVYIQNVPQTSIILERAKHLCKETYMQFEREGLVVTISCSVGVALANNKMHFHDLYQEADEALYQAKKKGRNQFVLYGGTK